ncbi:hypothetical protein TWF106_000166 [Orbilia oligospora]|uniref:PIN domain-containing protein n=1 Tax=Orbilia oligospora TaxID=2813651 RepID=A0A6G1MM42_ORBOL|nr:hypothetical protein TWF679_006991 [Orbilia oligospora]KAF3229681.1 hypothetical protein TWF106_000069 [Orbilia oligospora]KAF3229778.1 hypothetical protein TWF106_000166 [Orbilia oligospora]KAF3230079.1 hypothetical protein TWF191_000319 [Orbilia oligospora]KAF3262468.1 hypothetical protein TWF192_007143 [Orbilia oligospora]
MSVIVRNNQKVGILYHSILEYISKPAFLKSKSSVNNVIQGPQSKGIQVLASSNQEEDSISLAGEIMKDAYAKVKADLATSKANKDIRPKDIKSTLSKQWTTVLDPSRTDLILACAAHVKGSAFITADQVFAADFGKEAARRGVRIYVVPASWGGSSTELISMGIGQSI